MEGRIQCCYSLGHCQGISVDGLGENQERLS
jgi:hypothetical protein